MSVDQWVAAIVAGAGVFGIRDIIPGLLRWTSGRSDREKTRFQELLADRDTQADRADTEATRRRILEEYASGLRRHLISVGIPADDIAPWPAP